jgi:hypothetical protein
MARKRTTTALKPRAVEKQRVLKSRATTPPGFRPLVEADRLFFRVLPSDETEPYIPAAGQSDGKADKIARIFAGAFSRVWNRIPLADRHALLEHWNYRARSVINGIPDSLPRPVVDVISPHVRTDKHEPCDYRGHWMTFRVAGRPQRVAEVRQGIARALAIAMMSATGANFRLCLETVDEPMERWEQSRSRKPSENVREKQLEKLDAIYAREFDSAVEVILRCWRFWDE